MAKQFGKSGTGKHNSQPGKSPKYRQNLKREAEKNTRPMTGRIKNPASSMDELMRRK